jgi:flagellar basal body-associated protein FliL
MDLDVINEIDAPNTSLVDLDETLTQKKEKKMKKRKVIRYSLLVAGIILVAIVVIILIVVLGKKNNNDNSYLNVIKAKYIINDITTNLK